MAGTPVVTGLTSGRWSGGNFDSMGKNGYFWSSNVYNTGNAWLRALDYNYDEVYRAYYYKFSGYNSPCLKD